MRYYKKTIPTRMKEAIWVGFVVAAFLPICRFAVTILDEIILGLFKVSTPTNDYWVWAMVGMPIGIIAGAFYQVPRTFGTSKWWITKAGLALDLIVMVSVTALTVGYEPLVDLASKWCARFNTESCTDIMTRCLISFSILYGWLVGRIYAGIVSHAPMPQHWKLIKYHRLAK